MTATMEAAPLLMTKLFVPRVQTDLIARGRVFQRLEEGLRRRLTLVSAPAGFGKTSLLTSWLHTKSSDELAIAWFSLDERDNDSERFLSYLIEAFQLADSALGAGARELLGAGLGGQPELVMTRLINDAGALAGEVILVLDDYHVIETPDIHAAVDFLIEHMPPQLHLVITSRVDPPLALSRLRGRGEMLDITAADLRFTVAETQAFLRSATEREVDAGDVAELERRTEGWITGLQLAAISIRDTEDVHGFIQAFSGQHHHIFDYLADEVLARQPPEIQTFLLQTSLFDRLSAGLCDAVTGRDDSDEVLTSIERSNLFIASLDNERRWFRYHHLFAGLLRRKLRQAQSDHIAELRRRASDWFETQGDHVEAIWQVVHAEAWDRAGDLIETHRPTLYNQGRSKTILQLTEAIPDEVMSARPWLLDARLWANILNGRPDRAWQDLADLRDLIEREQQREDGLPEADRSRLRGSVAAARAIYAILDNAFGATRDLCDEALRLLPEDALHQRSMTANLRAQAVWLLGDLEASAASSQEAIRLSQLTDAPLFRIIGYLGVASIDVEWGQFERAAGLYRQALDFAARRGLARWQYTGRVLGFQSEIPYERNDLETALEIARAGREIAGHWSTSMAYDISYLHLARVHYARRELDSARSILAQAPGYANMGPGASDVAQKDAFLALIDLEVGQTEQLEAIERQLLTPVAKLLDTIWLWTPAVRTRAQILNALGRCDDAATLTAPLFEICLERGWVRQAIQTGSVLALSYQELDAERTAVDAFERVLKLAERRGFLRSILDAGHGIDGVIEVTLRRRRAEGADTVYLNHLLRLAREERQAREVEARTPNQGLVEPLSERELEILRLIAAGYTNAQIADELFVVIGTIKSHAHNIYGKLGVRNRTQAINRGRELGLVD